jgi:hypothetical protein
MRAIRVALRVILSVLFFLGLVVMVSAISYRAGFNARCTIGNIAGPFTPDNIKAQHELGFDWSRHALICKMGEYQVVTPSEAGRGEGGYILRKGRLFLAVTEKETDLFDDSGERFLFALTRTTSRGIPGISYSAYDPAKGAWIENFDVGADGTLDYRTTEVNGRKVKEEYRVGEHWLEKVQRESH